MKWEELSMRDRTAIMAAAVRNGYTDIRSIKEAYANYQNQKLSAGNRYAEGGNTDDFEVVNPLDSIPAFDEDIVYDTNSTGEIPWFIQGTEHAPDKPLTNQEYYTLMEEVAEENNPIWNALRRKRGEPELTPEEEFARIINDNSYDYRSYYNDPSLRDEHRNADTHWTDHYKTVYHPTFSNQSLYSGKIEPNYNPQGKIGGTWLPYDTFIPNDTFIPENYAYGGNLFDGVSGTSRMKKKSRLSKGRLGISDYEREKAAYYRNELIKRGITNPVHLDAIIANMAVESTFNPSAADGTGAHGLMQWMGSRIPKDMSEKGQLDYIAKTYNHFGGNDWHNKDAYKRFNTTNDPVEAANLMRIYWERCAPKYHYKAGAWLNLYNNNNNNTIDTYHPMQDVTWADTQARRKRFELTPEEKKLLDSKPTLFYNADYTDWQNPDNQKTFEQAYAPYALNSELDNDYSNGWALYNSLLQSQNLSDPLSWMTIMASLSPKTTPEQKQAANWLFNMTGDGGQLYHGLNFAAYGGNMFNKGGNKNKQITEQEMQELGWHWGDVSEINPTDPLAQSTKNRGNEKFIFDEAGNLVSKDAVEQYINSINLPELIVTPNKNKFNLQDYVKSKLQDRLFETIFPGFMDVLTQPMEPIVGPIISEDPQIKKLLKKIQSDIISNTYDPNFATYAITNPYVMKNSIFFNSINPLVRRFDDGGNISATNNNQEQTITLNEVDSQGLTNPMYEYDPKYYEDYGIGNHPDFDEDFRNRYGLRYAPYDEVDFGDTSPDDIRLSNQQNVTVNSFQGQNPNGTLLVGPDNKLINQLKLTELSQQYRTDNNEALRMKYYHLKGEKPLEQKNPEFYLLAGGAHAMLGLANEGLAAAVVDPMMNMQLTDGFIDDTTPYTDWGNMMSNEVDGSELMWDMAHPAIVKDVAKGAVNAVKNAVSPSKARTGIVGDFIDNNNMPEPSANWNGDWAALEEYRATHGGQERLQAAYDELSKAASTNANAKAKIDALRLKHNAEQLALIQQHIAKNGASAMYTRTPGLSELAAKLEQELTALCEELGYNKAYNNAPEFAVNHYLVPTTEEIHNIPVTDEGDAAYAVIEPSVDEATGEVKFINRSVNNPFDGIRGNRAFAHEVNHQYVPYADGQLEWLDMNKLDPGTAEYFKSRGGIEIAARGSLVKNYFGLREGEGVTPEMLQYAAEHYVNDVTAGGGIDNTMSEFFSAITDYDAAAKWINKWALGITPAAIGGTTAATAITQNQESANEGYAFGGPLVRIANNLFYDGGFYDLPEQRAYRKAVNLKAPYTNYEDAVDMDDSIMLRLKKFLDKGVSNCTLTVSQLYGDPIGRANTIVTDPQSHNFYQVDEGHIVPGTMVIASHPNMSDYNPELNYHTMIVTGFAPNDYEYTFRDGTKYQIKKGEPLVSYSRGKASADNYVHDVPLSVYNANSEGKTYNRYYRPIDENYPQVMLPEITFTK